MNIPISLSVSMLACLLGGMIRKYYTERYGGAGSARHVFNAVTSAAAAAVLFLWGGISSASPFTLILGAAFGVVTAVQTITTLAAMERGPWAYTTVITSLSMLIPTLSGALIWHESIGPLKIVGIVFMVACLVLSVDGGKDAEKRRASFAWLLFCAIAFLFQGGIGVMQKWHQSSAFKEELNAFLVVAFAVSFLYSTVSALILRKKEEHPARDTEMPLWKRALPWVMMVAGGVCVALNNKLNLYLSGVMDSAVFFPLVNGGGLILTTLCAFFLFRERLSLKQWIGLASGTAAVLMLCMG